MTKKEKMILEYCSKNLEYMWAAQIAGIILDCGFRDAVDKINKEKNNEKLGKRQRKKY